MLGEFVLRSVKLDGRSAVCARRVSKAAALSFLVMVALGAAGIREALAEDRVLPPGVSQAQAAGTIEFDIPAQSLASALTAYGRQAGLQVLVDSASVAGKTSTPVVGAMTSSQALQRLLGGTGIPYRFTSSKTVTVGGGAAAAPGIMQLDPVQVQGYAVPAQAMIDNLPPPYAGGQVATGGQLGMLGERDVMDTPFNQTSYTAKKVQDQQARTIRDALIDDPSVQSYWPSASNSSDATKIRGFVVNADDTSYGGLYGMLPSYSVAAELAERVEVLKGPSAMLNGMPPGGSIGGTINIAPKRAPNAPLTQVTANYLSAGQFGGHVDLGRRFGADQQVGVRFNGVFRAGQTAVERNSDQLGLGLLGLDFRGQRVRFSMDLGYQYEYIGAPVAYPNIAAGVAVPAAPDASSSFSQPWSYAERKDLFGVFRTELDVTEHITAYVAMGAHDNRAQVLDGGFGVITNVNGNITQAPFRQNAYTTYLTAEAGLRALVETGPISHALNFSASNLMLESGAGYVQGAGFTSNIYNPTFIAPPNLADPAANKAGASSLSSVAFADTLSAAGNRIQLTAGGRLQRVTARNFDTVTGAQTSDYDQSAFSPSAALVFKPWETVSIYGNFIQGLRQGTVVGPTFANAGEILPPYKSTQYEVGVKVDWGKFTTTVSAFQISQPSTITDLATNTLVLAGQQRNRGLEINVFGEPMDGVRLLGGAMLMNAVLTQTQGGLYDGAVAAGVPDLQLNLAGEWDLPFARGLTLNSRVIYTAPQYLQVSTPRRSIPGWARWDLGARYTFENVRSPFGKQVVIRFNVDNVLDSSYWSTVSPSSYLVMGAPRTFRLATTFDF